MIFSFLNGIALLVAIGFGIAFTIHSLKMAKEKFWGPYPVSNGWRIFVAVGGILSLIGMVIFFLALLDKT